MKEVIEELENKPELQTTLNTDGLAELVAEGEVENVVQS